MHDLRHALRRLARAPLFTAGAVLTLALGIGANTAIFSVIDAVLIRPLPYPDEGRLVFVEGHTPDGDQILAPTEFLQMQRETRLMTAVAGVRELPMNVRAGEQPEKADGATV